MALPPQRRCPPQKWMLSVISRRTRSSGLVLQILRPCSTANAANATRWWRALMSIAATCGRCSWIVAEWAASARRWLRIEVPDRYAGIAGSSPFKTLQRLHHDRPGGGIFTYETCQFRDNRQPDVVADT